MTYKVITDGAYSYKRDQGGICFIILNEQDEEVARFSKAYKRTTNNRMEMLACIIALESIKEPSKVEIKTDSQYVIGCASKGWTRRKNVDLWERFDKAMRIHKEVSFVWVKGHANDAYNEICDKEAVKCSQNNYEELEKC